MEILSSIRRGLPWGDPPDEREVEGDIADELAFHLEMRAQEYVEQGMDPDDARAKALERFGDVERVRDECRAIQLRERAMLQKIQLGVIVVLVVTVGVLGYDSWNARRHAQAADARHRQEIGELAERIREKERLGERGAPLQAPESGDRVEAAALGTADELHDVDYFRERLAQNPDDWRHGWSVVGEIAELPPEEAIAMLGELWPLMSVPVKEQAFKPFVFGDGHPFALKVLDMGLRDEAPSVQGRAMSYLRTMTFQDFSEDYEAGLAWMDANRDRPLGEVMVEAGGDFLGRLGRMPLEDVAGELERFGRGDWDMAMGAGVDLREYMRDEGGLAMIESWLAAGDEETAEQALTWASQLQPEEDWMRANLLPILDASDDQGLLGRAANVFERNDCGWAVEPLTERMLERAGRSGQSYDRGAKSIAGALGEIGDPRSIPAMIAMIEADGSYDTVYGVGYFGLGRITGVPYDESHDGAWWREWWAKNQSRFPADVASMPIPVVK